MIPIFLFINFFCLSSASLLSYLRTSHFICNGSVCSTIHNLLSYLRTSHFICNGSVCSTIHNLLLILREFIKVSCCYNHYPNIQVILLCQKILYFKNTTVTNFSKVISRINYFTCLEILNVFYYVYESFREIT